MQKEPFEKKNAFPEEYTEHNRSTRECLATPGKVERRYP